MKEILSLRRHGYLKTIAVFLIAVALIAGVVGCEGEGEVLYTLTMAVDPPGSGEAIDVTGASAHAAGAAVDIQAIANPTTNRTRITRFIIPPDIRCGFNIQGDERQQQPLEPVAPIRPSHAVTFAVRKDFRAPSSSSSTMCV